MVTLLTRQLATLLSAGLPLVPSLETLRRQTGEGAYGGLVEGIAEELREGSALSEAMEARAELFDPMMIHMTRAGEAVGKLGEVLRMLADAREKSARLRRRVLAAMVYPVVVLSVATLVVAMLILLVIPQFEQIYETSLDERELPLPTAVLVGLSAWLSAHVLGIVVSMAIGLPLFRWLLGSETGRLVSARLVWRLPICGGLVRSLAMTRFSRTLATLLKGGVPLLESLQITANVVNHPLLSPALLRLRERVRDGESLSDGLRSSPLFPPLVSGLVGVGEETGALVEVCLRIAESCEEALDAGSAALASLLEPAMIILLAVVVGGIVVSLFLPLIGIFESGGTMR